MPVIFYGCEIWSLAFRENRRLTVFESRVLRRIFGSKRDGVTGNWRKLHNEELHDLYSSPNVIRVIKSRRMKWVGIQYVCERGKAYTGLLWGGGDCQEETA